MAAVAGTALAPKADIEDRSSATRRPVVIVVDDVLLVRLLIAQSLRDRGFEIVEASSGEEAIRALSRALGAITTVDAVFADVHMPMAEVDGPALARWIQLNRPEVKVLLGSGMTAQVDLANDVGPVLQKPYDFDEVERRLREMS